MNTVGTGLYVDYFGTISIGDVSATFTNVTTKYIVGINAYDKMAFGIIAGKSI